MSVSLTVRGNRPCVEMVDFRGEIWVYRVELVANTERLFSVRLTKLDDPDEPTYLVQLGRGWWSCDCNDWTYRKKQRPDGCKHIQHVSDPDFRPVVVPLVAALTVPTVSQGRAL